MPRPADARPGLSLILPIYNEELVIPELFAQLQGFLSTRQEEWEVVLIDDGSSDRSLEMLRAEAAAEPRYRVLSFARNFGHQIAITAGVDYAEGDAVVILDADLQDPPEVIGDMLDKFQAGYDVVYGVRERRDGESWFKKMTAMGFYRILRLLSGVDIPVDTGDFRLMSRRVVLTLRGLRETSRFVRGMVAWIGFKQTAVYYQRSARFAGETHYPFSKMLGLAMNGIVSFSTVPLKFAVWLGVLSGFIALGVAGWAIYTKLFVEGAIPGWATIMLGVSLASSAQLMMIGILGEYVGRIYEELKRRPLYIVAEELNVTNAPEPPPTSLGPSRVAPERNPR